MLWQVDGRLCNNAFCAKGPQWSAPNNNNKRKGNANQRAVKKLSARISGTVRKAQSACLLTVIVTNVRGSGSGQESPVSEAGTADIPSSTQCTSTSRIKILAVLLEGYLPVWPEPDVASAQSLLARLFRMVKLAPASRLSPSLALSLSLSRSLLLDDEEMLVDREHQDGDAPVSLKCDRDPSHFPSVSATNVVVLQKCHTRRITWRLPQGSGDPSTAAAREACHCTCSQNLKGQSCQL